MTDDFEPRLGHILEVLAALLLAMLALVAVASFVLRHSDEGGRERREEERRDSLVVSLALTRDSVAHLQAVVAAARAREDSTLALVWRLRQLAPPLRLRADGKVTIF